jgi:hypothetical protein
MMVGVADMEFKKWRFQLTAMNLPGQSYHQRDTKAQSRVDSGIGHRRHNKRKEHRVLLSLCEICCVFCGAPKFYFQTVRL